MAQEVVMGKAVTGKLLHVLFGTFLAILSLGAWGARADCDDDYCYRPRPRVYYYAPTYDMYNPRHLPPLRPGDNGMLPGVQPRQEWFNKYGTTGYTYYGYYGYNYRFYRPTTCGRYRYWTGYYCADARWHRPWRHAHYY
jgi:hypothetical protein